MHVDCGEIIHPYNQLSVDHVVYKISVTNAREKPENRRKDRLI